MKCKAFKITRRNVKMARVAKVKVDTKDYINCPIESWNGTTFREYAKHLNISKYGIPCMSNNVMVENSMVKNLTKEVGNVVAKKFFEECIKTHQGSDKYPTCNVGFMITYMKASVLPRVMNQEVKKSKIQSLREQIENEQITDVENYF